VVDAVKGVIDSKQLPDPDLKAVISHWVAANVAVLSASASVSIFMFRRFKKCEDDDAARAKLQVQNKGWLRAVACLNEVTKICIVVILLTSLTMWDIKNFFLLAGSRTNVSFEPSR